MPDLLTEFPDYPAATLPEIPAGFEPSHWHNDACPSWQRGDLRLFVDYVDPARRDLPNAPRFSLQRMTPAGADVVVDSDDWTEILAALAKEG